VSDASTRSGPGRILVAVYAIFALSATARSSVQIGTDFDNARLAYSLSAVAAAIYILATFGLARGGRVRPLAWAACAAEAVGVFTIGTVSIVASDHFPDATVWSVYGQGYGFVPAVLPFLGLAWLWRTREAYEG
jgi:hypothetical protein